MLTHASDQPAQLERYSNARIHAQPRDAAQPGSLKGFLAGTLLVVAATIAAWAVIALKAAYFLSHFSY